MKITIEINTEKFEGSNNSKYIIEQAHDELLKIDESTTVTYTDEDNELHRTAYDFIEEELCEGSGDEYEIPYEVLDKDKHEIVAEIYEKIERDAVAQYTMCNGGYSEITKFTALKYKDKNKLIIRIFADITVGVQDIDGSRTDSYYAESLWTETGEFISSPTR